MKEQNVLQGYREGVHEHLKQKEYHPRKPRRVNHPDSSEVLVAKYGLGFPNSKVRVDQKMSKNPLKTLYLRDRTFLIPLFSIITEISSTKWTVERIDI